MMNASILYIYIMNLSGCFPSNSVKYCFISSMSFSTLPVGMNVRLHFISLRPLFDCKIKNFSSLSDFTVGDYWGAEVVEKDIDDNKSVIRGK